MQNYGMLHPRETLNEGKNFQEIKLYCNETLNNHYQHYYKFENIELAVFISRHSSVHMSLHILDHNYQSIRYRRLCEQPIFPELFVLA